MLFENLLLVGEATARGAALNMAIDEVLLRQASEPVLRIYGWERPAISFGYFEKVDELRALPPGWERVRRWTGGGVVEHGQDVTYTLIAPAGHPFAALRAGDSYCAIHRIVARLLAAHGTATSLAERTAPKISSGCFENPAEADVLAEGRKVAGAAQRRTRWGLLHQGSIQSPDLPDDFREQLANAFSAGIERRELTAAELSAAAILAGEKYATEAWLRRF